MNDRERARRARREELRQALPIIVGLLGVPVVMLATVYLPHRYLALILAFASFFVGWKIGNRPPAPEDASFMATVTISIFVIGLGLLILAMGVAR